MRLFVDEPGRKIYLAASADTRCELAQKLSDRFRVKIEDAWYDYDIGDVYAEPAGRVDIAFAMIGALVGLVAGPLGVIFGSFGGYLLGFHESKKEERRAKIFNESHIGGSYGTPGE